MQFLFTQLLSVSPQGWIGIIIIATVVIGAIAISITEKGEDDYYFKDGVNVFDAPDIGTLRIGNALIHQYYHDLEITGEFNKFHPHYQNEWNLLMPVLIRLINEHSSYLYFEGLGYNSDETMYLDILPDEVHRSDSQGKDAKMLVWSCLVKAISSINEIEA